MNDVDVDIRRAVDPQALAAYLRARGVDLAGPLSVALVGGGKSNITCRVSDGRSRWILRRPPLGDVTAGAHDVGREFTVMTGLARSAVPVPPMIVECADATVLGAPFYLMEEVTGRVIRDLDDVRDLTEPQRRALGTDLVRVLADLHDVDAGSVGLGDLGRPEGYLGRQVDRWVRQMDDVRRRPLSHVRELGTVLRSSMPRTSEATIVHGDYRLDNVIVDPSAPTRVAAVLDWEMATLGDPLADLATLLMFWDSPDRPFNPITRGLMAAPGFPSADEAVAIYLERRGMPSVELDWYVVFSRFKLAVLLEQIRVRHESGQTLGGGFDSLGPAVDLLLEEAAETVRASPSLAAHLA
ncbi:phosphotransferase family protein [Aeromicrobium sp. CFBP 8757]|uniref:phosphotransferase family protein n=1 Tax=Aeromicrobium sp. CFBP 8757 TaxID=2775288 RepID=UPI0017807B19|nr:phosphotransferase family protein [Aeromicrobium sp. CFBP 8757]MBD8605456.1 phosphotransferase family protein [Aeromicrobium sp. CFBP 8757]